MVKGYSETADVAVIGAGVVGLAIGKVFADAGRDVLVLEAEGVFGSHTSSRNSEVLHAGIYYPHTSLKARLCVSGNRMLRTYMRDRAIAWNPCGKILVATSQREQAALVRYEEQARKNGVQDIRPLTTADITGMEPAVCAVSGLLSPSTAILDSHALMTAFTADIETAGGHIVCNAPAEEIAVTDAGVYVHIGGNDPIDIRANTVINAAGHNAPALARQTQGIPQQDIPTARYAAGQYYTYAAKSPFSRLIYPVAGKAGLGIHVTLDMGGQARFGPDVEWRDALEYSFNGSKRAAFVTSIKKYFPALDETRLVPGYVGVRPKIVPEGAGFQDFRIDGPAQTGTGRLVNLYGIESPGLTSCLAIAHYVRTLLQAV